MDDRSWPTAALGRPFHNFRNHRIPAVWPVGLDFAPGARGAVEFALLRKPGADGCKIINGPVTNEVCPKVDALRKELAASQQAAELEATLVADRKELQAAPVAASVADPQSATLSRLTALDEAKIRDIIAMLIALLVEIGSALGFTFVALASRPVSAAPALQIAETAEDAKREPERQRAGADTFTVLARRSKQRTVNRLAIGTPRIASSENVTEIWICRCWPDVSSGAG
jgi:hypothetical protein